MFCVNGHILIAMILWLFEILCQGVLLYIMLMTGRNWFQYYGWSFWPFRNTYTKYVSISTKKGSHIHLFWKVRPDEKEATSEEQFFDFSHLWHTDTNHIGNRDHSHLDNLQSKVFFCLAWFLDHRTTQKSHQKLQTLHIQHHRCHIFVTCKHAKHT